MKNIIPNIVYWVKNKKVRINYHKDKTKSNTDFTWFFTLTFLRSLRTTPWLSKTKVALSIHIYFLPNILFWIQTRKRGSLWIDNSVSLTKGMFKEYLLQNFRWESWSLELIQSTWQDTFWKLSKDVLNHCDSKVQAEVSSLG